MSQDRLQDFDKLFKEGLKGHELPVSDNVWNSLEQKRYGKKKRNYYLIAVFSIVGLIGLFWLGSSFINNSGIESPTEKKLELKEDRSDGMASIKNAQTLKIEDESSVGSVSGSQESTDRTFNSDFKSKKTDLQNSSNKDQVLSEKIVTNSDLINNDPSINSSSETLLDGDKEKSLSNARINVQEKDESLDLISLSSSQESSKKTTELGSLKTQLSNMAFEPLEIKENLLDTEISKTVKCPSLDFSRKTEDISISFSGGPVLSFHELSASQENTAYLNARKRSEQNLINYGVSAKIKKTFTSNLSLSTGFNYTKFNYRYVFLDSTESRRTVITIDTFYTHQGQTIRTDTLKQVEYGVLKEEFINEHELINIPVSVGYKIDLQDLFIEPYLGASVNLVQRATGNIPSLNDLSPSEVTNDLYQTRIGMVGHIGTTIGYNLSERTSIILQSEYNKVFKPITTDDAAVTEKRDWLNVHFGVQYTIAQKNSY